ncbi:uncharacterized protein LOC135500375 [Lineus longissimus]|uniref:uncharacterized protein LOC135500375 n=1 Tax=Lineus longissimus TaxID=88925 RepID=UPI002B4D5FC9
MAGRNRSDSNSGLESSNASSVPLPNVRVNKNVKHPETWTLPQEWNMEVRERFGGWKKDVQSQIVNIGIQLDSSMKNTGSDGLYQDGLTEAERRHLLEREVAQFTYTGPSKVGCKCKSFF